MKVPADCEHNAHIFYIFLSSADVRAELWSFLKKEGIQSTTHYVPLHSAPAGKKYGRVSGSLIITDDLANCLLRLPLFAEISKEDISFVIDKVHTFFLGR
jgi:dTDP-4-amino-4,6-dideoxygalactose transaminase